MSRAPAMPLLRLLPEAGKGLTLALLAGALIQPALGLGFILATGQLIGHIPYAVHHGLHRQILLALVAVGACYVGQQVLGAVTPVLGGLLGHRLDGLLADRLMVSQLAPRGIAHLQDPARQDLAERAMGGLGAGRWRPAEAPAALASLISSGLGVAAACALTVWFYWWLGRPSRS